MELCSVLAAKAKAIEVKEQYIEMRDTGLMPPQREKGPRSGDPGGEAPKARVVRHGGRLRRLNAADVRREGKNHARLPWIAVTSSAASSPARKVKIGDHRG